MLKKMIPERKRNIKMIGGFSPLTLGGWEFSPLQLGVLNALLVTTTVPPQLHAYVHTEGCG